MGVGVADDVAAFAIHLDPEGRVELDRPLGAVGSQPSDRSLSKERPLPRPQPLRASWNESATRAYGRIVGGPSPRTRPNR